MQAHHRLAAAAICCAFGIAAAPAGAVEDEDLNFDTTEDLYAVCSTTSDQPEHLAATFACRAFIEATVQYHDAVSDRKKMRRLICYPENATVGDGRRAFLSWAEANKDNAERMDELPVVGLVRALAARYPCR
ncbi:Rap1a/Tai family immunity protein [uncultured Thiohalocapsa sp.]|uniref:Rap1a/Tai family immunity protein n=1 Tax=uncultured Thiohalocapsa sp. TaxID=768990 RepID=UPI0025F42FDC|nr:Rap1a/Tai family immunity protein [uncultured Thiohalocapsa sp.]